MTGDQYKELATFDTQLAAGQRVVIRWTNSHRLYAAAATITKVNTKSVLASIDTAITDWQGWSANNCVTPLTDNA